MGKPIESRPLLTVKQAAERLHISVSTMRRLLAERSIAPVRIGGSVRVLPSDLDAYIKEGKEASA